MHDFWREQLLGNPTSLRTADVDEARVSFSEALYANQMRPLGPSSDFLASFDFLPLSATTVARLSFGTDVGMHVGELGAFHVGLVLQGSMAWRQGGREPQNAGVGRAMVFHPEGDIDVERRTGDCRTLSLKIDEREIYRQLELQLGRAPRGPLRFTPTFDVSGGPGEHWAGVARAAARSLFDSQELRHPLVSGPLQEALIAGMLRVADHRYRDDLDQPPLALRPAPVKRALNAIHDRPEHPFTNGELAAVARVSVRWLQEGFRRYVGMPPGEHLRMVRLQKVHEELRVADPSCVRVGDVAHKWGFTHLGRFAAQYRRRFGEPPSQTLLAAGGR
ncbi:AraC family transcriptional regulator [Streptomyces monticola]|uniref:AraC family transcriptional regulator n=1 Tax=Streptomyces monticola TaxID=2666263 RepID=A0ABW2JES6_9ACTN